MTPGAGTGAVGTPAAKDGVVAREGLLGRLTDARRVVQVSAPPGSGKTVLVESWVAASGMSRSTARVLVLPQEHDPQRLWLSVVAALRGTGPGAALVRDLTAAPDLDGWTVVERLLDDLAPLADTVWLVIDDVHELASDEGRRQLELFILRAPVTVRFVLLTRHDLRLGLHRLRLAGELTEIRAADLRFSIDEARALFQAAQIPLSETSLGLLHQRTEGWAAGLRLAALSLAGHPDPDRFAAEFGGSERTVAEYLMAEVLERQPENVRHLLLRTSILRQVTGELADVLTGDAGGEGVLQHLEEAGAFVIAIDARRSAFRYHQLFADLLQLNLRGTEPAKVPALHIAAAEWYSGHGDPVEAVRHAVAVADWTLGARILSEQWVGLGLNGLGATVHELLARFPADLLAADAELAGRKAADELARGSLQEADQYLAIAADGLDEVPADRRGRARVSLAVVRLRLARQRGDLPAVSREAQQLISAATADGSAHLRIGPDLRALALIELGIAELWTAQFGQAGRHLDDGIALARQIGRPYLEVTGLVHSAQLVSWESFPLGARRSREAIDLATRHGWADEPVTGIAYLALGVSMVTQARLDDAERALAQAERILRAEVEPAAGMRLRYGRGMLEFVRGRHETALSAFRAAERLANSLVSPHTLAPRLRSHVLQTLVRTGKTSEVERILADLDQAEREQPEMRIAEASLLLARREPAAAAIVLAAVTDGSAPLIGAHLWEVQSFLLLAIACDELGDQAGARRALERALDHAAPERLLFPFLYDPAPDLLDRHRRYGTAHAGLIAEVLAVLAGTGPGASPPAPRLLEPLSHAESRVLRYLPTKLSAPEIASDLFLSVNTVKTHMRHLYDKLGVHRRHEAVERARALGLLAPSPRGS